MKKCNKCNFESNEFEFCPKCGSKLEKVEENKVNSLEKISTLAKNKIRDRNKISSSDKKIMIVVFSIIFLCIVAGLIFGNKQAIPYPSDYSNDQVNENSEVSNEIDQLKEDILSNIKKIGNLKYNEAILNKINDNEYELSLMFKYAYGIIDIKMGIDGMDFINLLKVNHYDDIDKYISTYSISYFGNAYNENAGIVANTIYKSNHDKKKIESITLIANDGKKHTFTTSQINKYNEDSKKEAEELEKESERIKELSKYDIEVDAKTLSKVYYNNELDGNKKYFGKRIKTTGKFTSAEHGKLTGWNVVLVTGERYDYYCSTFVEGEEKHFSEYNRGETLIVYAKVDELVGGYLRLKDCDLERKK